MNKLTLNLESLAVESFTAGAGMPARGTVQANVAALITGVYSCAATCRCPSHHQSECCGIA